MNTSAASHRLLLASLWCLPATLSAQILQPVTVNVTTSFTNPAGPVRTLLNSVSGPGMDVFAAGAYTTEAVPRVASMTPVPAGSRTSASAALTVDATGNPSWHINTTTWLAQYGQQFFSGPSSPLAVSPGGGPYTLNIQHSVSVVDVQFGAAVSGGVILIYSADKSITFGQVSAVPAGSTHSELVVPGGKSLVIEASMQTGSGGESGTARKIFRSVSNWSGPDGVPNNSIQTVSLNLNEAATLGSYTGTFTLAGADVLSVPDPLGINGWTNMSATYFSSNAPVYGSWRRTTVINNGGSATGPFTLAGLASTASIAANDPGPSSGYGVQAAALLRRTLPSGGLATQYLRTRLMQQAELPAVPGGGSASLGTRFNMTPATVRGTLLLRGPAPQPGSLGLLSRIQTAADSDSNSDGLPEGSMALNTGNWLYVSGIFSNTVINSSSSYGGTGWQIMERTYSAPDVQCEYDIALASPAGETAEWTAPGVTLVMQNGGALENEYFDTVWTAQRRGAPNVSGAPGSVTTRNDSMDLGEVTVIVRSSPGSGVNIWQPRLLSQENALTGDPVNVWNISNIRAYGWPSTSAGAAARASLRTLLPAGTYTLRPTVQTSGGSASSLAPFTITVPARGRITVDNGLTVGAYVPPCVSPDGRLVSGTVASGGVGVTSITWRIDGGSIQNAAFVPGDADPPFTLNIPGLPAGSHSITITVTTEDGRTGSVTYVFQTDRAAPVIQPIPDVVIVDAPVGGQTVSFPSPVVTDDCPSIAVICNPPSGSLFPLGTTTVTCTALDLAGNTATRTFNVILRQACPPPVRSHYYSGAAGCWFQHPDKPAYHSSVPMTVEAWVKRTDGNRCETILSQNYVNSFWFGFCPALRFYRSGGAYADADTPVPANQWTHVAVSYDGSEARFYINGQSAGVKALSNSGGGVAAPVTIGADFTSGGSDYGFQGWMDEIHVFNRALPATEFSMDRISRVLRLTSYPGLISSFGSGGALDELSTAAAIAGPAAPQPMTEGILPKYSVVPRTRNAVTIDGVINNAGEYEGAEQMVLRYSTGPTVADAIARLVYRDEPGDEALYIGITGLRDVVAPWTRAQSFVSVYFQTGNTAIASPVATFTDFRFSRRLDGSTAGGSTPVGFERGDNAGNYGPLAGTDPLLSAASPFGIIGGGGSTMEFRFDRSVLGSAWKKEPRVSVAHHWISGIGMDANAPAAAGYSVPDSWSDVIFGGEMPVVRMVRAGTQLKLRWPDPGCQLFLQGSTTLLPLSWTDIFASQVYFFRDDLFREAEFNMDLAPRRFFRLIRR